MPDSLLKSSEQLKYELNNIENELTSLLNNWRKKKEESLGQIVTFRAELKELDAVMAATEVSYISYLGLVNLILNLGNPDSRSVPNKGIQYESLPPELTPFPTETIQQIIDVTHLAEEAETNRITGIRAKHQTQSAFIQRKTKEIYGAMREEKNSVETYAAHLKAKIEELEEQYGFQIKAAGLGIGL